MPFARCFCFEVSRRDVKQVLLRAGDMRTPRDVDSVTFVTIASRPELLEAAYPVAQQGYENMPNEGGDIPPRIGSPRKRHCPRARSSHSPATRSSATRD